MRKVLLAVLLAALPVTAEVSPLWPRLAPGAHHVGFKAFPLRDYTRASLPVMISVWYPATETPLGVRMTYDSYSRYENYDPATLQPPDSAAIAIARRGWKDFFERPFNFPDGRKADDASWERLWSTEMFAVLDAPPVSGSFPLLLGSNGSLANASTNELLASHGYIVASVASMIFPAMSAVERVEFAARNAEFTLGWMRSFPNVDHERVGAMGFSAGGFGVYIAAMRNSDIDALAAIDSALYMPAYAEGLAKHNHYGLTKLRIPFMHMFRGAASASDEDLAEFRRLRYADRYRFLLDDPRLVHQDYSTHGAASLILGIRGDEAQASSRGFTEANRQLVQFFDAHLKGKRSELLRDDDVVTVERLAAVTPAPSDEEARALFATLGVEGAMRRLSEARAIDPDAAIFTNAGLSAMGYAFVSARNLDAARAIATLLEKQAPDSTHLHNHLGNIRMNEGKNAEAIAHFEKAIEALPRSTMSESDRVASNRNIGVKIRRLQEATAPRLWGSLTPGPHRVGFRVHDGRSAPGSAGWEPRDIMIGVWYPAQADGETLTFGDLFSLASDLQRRSSTLATAITGDAAGISSDVEKLILESPQFARRDATAVSRSFPVVLWSARYGTVAAQSVLSEYLASHGYVVAATWPKNSQEKLPFEAKTAGEKIDELDAQSDDLRGALRFVRALAVADDQRAAVLAWSYAGESAWRLAQGDARIETVIGLDTNVHANWVYQPRASVPIRFSFVKVDRSTPELQGAAHGNFNALEGMIPAIFSIDRVQPWSKGGPAAKSLYETISRLVREALDGVFATPPAVTYSTVELTAADGSTVTADLYRPGPPVEAGATSRGCVALFHQSGSSRGEFRTIAPELVRQGFTALAVDVRWGELDRWNDVPNQTAARHGTAAARQNGDLQKVQKIRRSSMQDLDAGIDYLRAQGCSKPIVWGSSIHANGVFELASRRPPDVSAVIDMSPGEYDREQPDKMKATVARVETPSLVMWGRTERDLSKPIFDAVAATSKDSYESTGRHGDAIVFEDPDAWPRIHEFLQTLR